MGIINDYYREENILIDKNDILCKGKDDMASNEENLSIKNEGIVQGNTDYISNTKQIIF